MPRAMERTERLPEPDVVAWRTAFGNAAHAFKCVVKFLPDDVPWSAFRNVVTGKRCRPVEINAVQSVWRQWKATPK